LTKCHLKICIPRSYDKMPFDKMPKHKMPFDKMHLTKGLIASSNHSHFIGSSNA
jgi:hypothetical protein